MSERTVRKSGVRDDDQRKTKRSTADRDATLRGQGSGSTAGPVPRRRFLQTAAVVGVGTSVTTGVTSASSQKYDIHQFSLDEDWVNVNLDNYYYDPVVIAGPLTHVGPDPATARLRNVSGGSFEAKVEEWKYLNGDHKYESLSAFVMEEGVHHSDEGYPIEFGTVDVTDTMNWSSVSFSANFSSEPIVIASVQTYNGADPIVTRNRNVTENGFEVTFQEEEALGGHYTETVGYLAVDSVGHLNDRQYSAEYSSGVDDSWTYIYDWGLVGNDPLILMDMQTFNGNNTAALRYRMDSNESVDAHVEEEQSADSETTHNGEAVGTLAIEHN